MAITIAGKETKVLLEERADLFKKAQAHHAENEDNWTPEHDAKHKEMMGDVGKYADAIKLRAQLEQANPGASNTPAGDGGTLAPSSHNDAPRGPLDPHASPGASRRGEDAARMIEVRAGRGYHAIEAGRRGSREYQDAFRHALSTDVKRAGLDMTQSVGGDGVSQYATLQSDDAQRGGYMVADQVFAADLLKEVDDLLFVMQRAKVHTVPDASSLGIRKRTAKLSSFDWSSELQVSDRDTSLKYGKKVLTPHHLTGSVKLSRDLARRSGMMVGEVRSELARDGAEAMEDGFLLGNGDRKPLGVFVASDDGISTSRDQTTGSSTNFTSDGLIQAKYGLKAQYRRGQRGDVSWLLHRDAIEKIALLKDSNGQYLFRVGAGFAADNGAPEDMLLGFPVDESERAPSTFTTGQYVGILANWRYYEIAMSLDMEIQVLVELNARTNEYEYIARLKVDGMPTLEEAFVRLITN
jgi:HK97 family phage major capsid protein